LEGNGVGKELAFRDHNIGFNRRRENLNVNNRREAAILGHIRTVVVNEKTILFRGMVEDRCPKSK
jgi:hypothetical protein